MISYWDPDSVEGNTPLSIYKETEHWDVIGRGK